MINRTQDATSGAWTYADEDEHNFVTWVEAGSTTSHDYDFSSGLEMPWRHSLLSMDGFINGDERPLTSAEQAHLLHLRSKAFAAYKAGDFALQDASLGVLQSECRRLGMLPLANVGIAVKNGPESRGDAADKNEFIRLVRALPSPPCTLPAFIEMKELAPYARKYKGRDTLRSWINEAIPGVLKTGRPRKGTVMG